MYSRIQRISFHKNEYGNAPLHAVLLLCVACMALVVFKQLGTQMLANTYKQVIAAMTGGEAPLPGGIDDGLIWQDPEPTSEDEQGDGGSETAEQGSGQNSSGGGGGGAGSGTQDDHPDGSEGSPGSPGFHKPEDYGKPLEPEDMWERIGDIVTDEFDRTADQLADIAEQVGDALGDEADRSAEQIDELAHQFLESLDDQLQRELELVDGVLRHMEDNPRLPADQDPFNQWLKDRGVDPALADSFTNGLNDFADDPDTINNMIKDVIPGYGFAEKMIENIEASKTSPPRMDARRDPLYGLLVGRGVSPQKAKRVVDGINRIGDDPETLLTIIPGYGTIKHLLSGSWRR